MISDIHARDSDDAARWRFIRQKIRPYMEFEGKPVWYIDGQVVGIGETVEQAVDETRSHVR